MSRTDIAGLDEIIAMVRADAIHAERERCAKIAEAEGMQSHPCGCICVACEMPTAIAAAIRSEE